MDWYKHKHRDSGINFVTPQQRHCGEGVEIPRRRSHAYEQTRLGHPRQ